VSDAKLQAIPLGGVGEFGMNILALRYGEQMIVIDAGMMFPEAELLGVDIVIPDIAYLREHRDEVTGLRRQVQELLATAAETEAKIAAIDARRRDVDEVQAKATLITNLLEDVRVNLETVSEQKAVVDHLNERLAGVQFVIQEAQNTLRMLSQERELAERIEQSIRQLRTRSGGGSDEGRQTA